MNQADRSPQRFFWVLGLLLLVATALGAGLFLNHSPGGDVYSDPKHKDAAPPPPVTIAVLPLRSIAITRRFVTVGLRGLESGLEVVGGDAEACQLLDVLVWNMTAQPTLDLEHDVDLSHAVEVEGFDQVVVVAESGDVVVGKEVGEDRAQRLLELTPRRCHRPGS